MASSALGWRQLVLEEKPDPTWARIAFKREVIPDGLVSIAGDNLLHDSNIPRESRYRRHVFVNADTVAELIVWHHLP
jgi:hypothetical protein